jgi:hypothetical protein
MPYMIPTLGYPNRKLAIRALLARGWSEDKVARKIGVSLNYVRVIRCQSADGSTWDRRPTKVPIWTDTHAIRDLKPYADRSGISPEFLAETIIKAATKDSIIAEIIDGRAARALGRMEKAEPGGSPAHEEGTAE